MWRLNRPVLLFVAQSSWHRPQLAWNVMAIMSSAGSVQQEDQGVRVAGVVELADTPDLGSGGASRGGSSPSARTIGAEVRGCGMHVYNKD